MRFLAVAVFGLTACECSVFAPRTAVPTASPVAEAAHASEDELCGGWGDERARKKLDAVANASCARFVPAFEAAVRASCDGPLAEALWRIDDRRHWDGTYSHATRERRNVALGLAALPIVKAACPEHFDVDFGSGKRLGTIESADEHWMDCADHAELRLGIEGLRVGGGIDAAPAGAWLFAAALARLVSPRGMRHVRRFLVCETIERVAGYAREVGKGEVVPWLSPYLVEPLKN